MPQVISCEKRPLAPLLHLQIASQLHLGQVIEHFQLHAGDLVAGLPLGSALLQPRVLFGEIVNAVFDDLLLGEYVIRSVELIEGDGAVDLFLVSPGLYRVLVAPIAFPQATAGVSSRAGVQTSLGVQ